ncbi:MAG: hypothetical protein HY820_27850 [Acidobacteria bacterium]|nr:hypothetical protein [Acidobacteriota bacterium]
MSSYALEISGLYDHREEGEKAAQLLHEKGFDPIAVLPATDTTLNLLHIGHHGHVKKFFLTVAAYPVGFVLGALCATPVALLFGTVFAGPVAFVCGIVGIVLGTAYVRDHWTPPCDHHTAEAVVVTTECDPEVSRGIVETLEATKADEVDVNKYVEADFLYQKGVH